MTAKRPRSELRISECALRDIEAMHGIPRSRGTEAKMIKVELRVEVVAWDTEEEEKPGELPRQHMGTQIVFSEDSIKDLRTHHNMDGVKELVQTWWRDLEKILPGKLEDMARKALGL